jgi:hypothetical protein
MWASGIAVAVTAIVFSAGAIGNGTKGSLDVVPAAPGPGLPSQASPHQPTGPSPAPAQTGGNLSGVASPGAPAAPQDGRGNGLPVGGSGPESAKPTTSSAPRNAYNETPETHAYNEVCAGTLVVEPSGHRLCTKARSTNGTRLRSGTATSFEVEVCNSMASPGDYAVAYASGREHDVRVRRSDTADEYQWTWSRAYTFPQGPHGRSLAPGNCLTWYTPWHTEDDRGDLLPPGDYTADTILELSGRSERVMVAVTIASD